MWRTIVLVLSLICQGQKILEYRPGVNYGQVLRDYSNNGRHAVSGSTSLSEATDVIPTDRGCYFDGTKSQKLTLPPNDISTSSFTIPSTFMIALWVLVDTDQEGLIFARHKDSSNFIYLRRYKATDSAAAKIVLNGNIVGEGSYATSSFLKGN